MSDEIQQNPEIDASLAEPVDESPQETIPEVRLLPVDRENWKDCVNLSVPIEQEAFIAENWYSLLQWTFEENLFPYCIYADEVMVGFLMYGLDPDTHRWELSRLMIDGSRQRKGYAKAALALLLDIVRERLGNITFYTSVDPENEGATNLYQSAGFEKTGEVMWEEDVMKIML